MDSNALKESLIFHCKLSIKSLRQLLTTLQSSGGIRELQQDEETMAGLSEIASLASSVDGISRQSLDDGADPVEDGMDSDRTRNKPSFEAPPFPRTFFSRPPIPSMGFSPEGKRLHSILLHYPLMSMIGLPLHVAEKDRIQQDIERVTSTPLGSRSYPRIRLLANRNVVLILHDDADELERLRSRLVVAQQSLWEQSSRIEVNFRFVRRWGDPLILLIFWQHDSMSPHPREASVTKKRVEDIVAGDKDIAGTVMAMVPVLRQHQQLGLHDGLLTGAKKHQGGHIVRTHYHGGQRSFRGPKLVVIVPITSGDVDFAEDFAKFNSPFICEELGFEITTRRLEDPSDWLVKDSFRWDSELETVTSYT